MTQVVRYGGAALLAVLLATAGAWHWLSGTARAGVLVAAGVAYPVQVAAFGLLVRYRDESRRFLLVWMGGTAARMAVILLAALFLTRSGRFPPAPTLLALAGFFFGLLLMEPFFLGSRKGERTDGP